MGCRSAKTFKKVFDSHLLHLLINVEPQAKILDFTTFIGQICSKIRTLISRVRQISMTFPGFPGFFCKSPWLFQTKSISMTFPWHPGFPWPISTLRPLTPPSPLISHHDIIWYNLSILVDYQSYQVWRTLDANLLSYCTHKLEICLILAETGQLWRHWWRHHIVNRYNLSILVDYQSYHVWWTSDANLLSFCTHKFEIY